jgi:hypothetical protein
MRLRFEDDVSLRASSEVRRLNLSSEPSVDLRRSSSRLSLLASDTVDDSGPFEGARRPGAAKLSPLDRSREEMVPLTSSAMAMTGDLRVFDTAIRSSCDFERFAMLSSGPHGEVGSHGRSDLVCGDGARVDYVVGVGAVRWARTTIMTEWVGRDIGVSSEVTSASLELRCSRSSAGADAGQQPHSVAAANSPHACSLVASSEARYPCLTPAWQLQLCISPGFTPPQHQFSRNMSTTHRQHHGVCSSHQSPRTCPHRGDGDVRQQSRDRGAGA